VKKIHRPGAALVILTWDQDQSQNCDGVDRDQQNQGLAHAAQNEKENIFHAYGD